MENRRKHRLSEYLEAHNFENLIYKAKDQLLASKSTPIAKHNSPPISKSPHTDSAIPSFYSISQNKLKFVAIPTKHSDEPIAFSEDANHSLSRMQSLESEYRLLEMEERIDSLDNEIQVQFKIMKAHLTEISSLPVPHSTPFQFSKSKTIVLDLDETLIHSIVDISVFLKNSNQFINLKKANVDGTINYFLLRPNMQEFLASISNYYNIIVIN